MSQENQDKSHSPNASFIRVGQLIYTSFQDCGFRMLMTSETPLYIQRSFVEKIVNARWDPHYPPEPGFSAAYVYQSSSNIDYSVFGWLYYDGHDEFGRAGVPYFVAYYLIGSLDKQKLQIILNCIEKGPIHCVKRHSGEESPLDTLILNEVQNYVPARNGVALSYDLWQNNQRCIDQKQPIDWFTKQTPIPYSQRDTANNNQNVSKQFQPRRNETTVTSLGTSTVNTLKIETILQELVDKTIGIQGAALVSEEGSPIVSVIGLNENTSGIIAGTILYMARESNKELNWSTFEAITLRGPDSYIMLSFCQTGVYLLIKSDKVPMGLLEGAVNRSIRKLNTELKSLSSEESIIARPALMPTHDEQEKIGRNAATPTKMEVETEEPLTPEFTLDDLPADLVADEEKIEIEPNLTYRGRPIN